MSDDDGTRRVASSRLREPITVERRVGGPVPDEVGCDDDSRPLTGGAVRRAALVVGAPVALWTVLDALAGELSWGTVLLRLLIWAVVSALMALAFSGGVEPRRDRDDR